MTTDKACCYGCEKRAVGCREACEAWAEHERKKAERYARKDLERRGTYLIGASPIVTRWEKERTKSARRKGGAF